jgi:hypothetical protein
MIAAIVMAVEVSTSYLTGWGWMAWVLGIAVLMWSAICLWHFVKTLGAG